MARRRLSDLLREEANKPSDDATAAAGTNQSADEPDAENLDVAEETATIAPGSASTQTTTAAKNASANHTSATEPQETLAQKQDKALPQQIAELTSALEAQKMTVEALQAELEQMHVLKTELEQTRKDLRELTDANAKLTKELKTSQTKKPAADTSTPATTAKAHSPQELNLAPPPVEASGHPLNSFNRDVGWFD